MQYAGVRLLNLPSGADKLYEYDIPLHLEGKATPGSIVLVPFGGANKVLPALCESVSDKKSCPTKLKPVLAVLSKEFSLSHELLKLCEYMRDTLLCSTADAVKTMLPLGMTVYRTIYYSINNEDIPGKPDKVNDPVAANVLEYIKTVGRASKEELLKEFGPAFRGCIGKLVSLGMCLSEDGYGCKTGGKSTKYAELCDHPKSSETAQRDILRLPKKQGLVYSYMCEISEAVPVSAIMDETEIESIEPIIALSKKGLIRLFDVELDRSVDALTEFSEEISDMYGEFTLSEEQDNAYKELLSLYKDEKANAALLWGVTGSGKTNVILKLIDKVLDDGKSVIILVPEIALTSQTVGRFAARYKKDGIALLHSGLSDGEKIDAKKRIAEGEAKIVIGTRSAIFAPVSNLGLVVIDEEHEASFKSDRSPKYHARDMARFRCAYNNALLVMASATPLVESFYRAKTGRYHLITLKNRYGNGSLPSVLFYDMKHEPYYIMPEDRFDPQTDSALTESKAIINDSAEGSAVPLILGRQLIEEITRCLEENRQIMLFINRRGYRAFALCRNCGYTFTCPNCSVSMTHHKDKRDGREKMVCHYCGETSSVPEICPSCNKKHITYVGSGTQLLEETLNKLFPKARVLRMDADTTSGKQSHEKILSEFRSHNADILVGTQMIAKGHDFPGVSLVGVALADTSLFVNDFRANEKTFSLLTQVLGRAGRSEGNGKAILQTYVPDNDVLNLAAKQDYQGFYNSEIAFRKANVFPPFCDIVTISLVSEVESDLITGIKLVHGEIDALATEEFSDVKFILFGPFKNEIYRLAGKYRMRFILKCRNTARTREMLKIILNKASTLKNVTTSVDINPTNL